MIKTQMPGVYAAVQEKAAEIGTEAYTLVRHGARGKPNCFFAIEGGRVVGTPFNQAAMAEVAQLIVQFGVTYLCMWPAPEGKGGDGAH